MAYEVGFKVSGNSLASAIGKQGITLNVKHNGEKIATIQIGKGGLWLRKREGNNWTKYGWKSLVERLTE